MHEEHDAEDQVWAEQQGLEELEETAEGEVLRNEKDEVVFAGHPDKLKEVFRGMFSLLFAITGEKPKAIDSPLGLFYCYAPRLGKDETDKLFRQVVEAIRDLGYMEDFGMVE